MNEWIVSYAVVCALLLAAIWRQRTDRGRLRWASVFGWLLCGAACTLLLWSTVGCIVLAPLGWIGPIHTLGDWAACVAVSALWATPVIIFSLPFYALLLSWYALKFARSEKQRSRVMGAIALLSIPGPLALLYGEATPWFGGILHSVVTALPVAVVAYVAVLLGLAIPRALIGRLALGQLVRDNAAQQAHGADERPR
jgi:hypothetical protein